MLRAMQVRTNVALWARLMDFFMKIRGANTTQAAKTTNDIFLATVVGLDRGVPALLSCPCP